MKDQYSKLSITIQTPRFFFAPCRQDRKISLIRPFYTIHAPPTSIPREFYFPHHWVNNYFQDGRRCKWVLRNESWLIEEIYIWLIDWLFFFDVWEWHSAASQEKTMLESCNLRCKTDGYFVSMYVWHAWNQILSTHLPECSTLSRLSHFNRMRAHGLWNIRIDEWVIVVDRTVHAWNVTGIWPVLLCSG